MQDEVRRSTAAVLSETVLLRAWGHRERNQVLADLPPWIRPNMLPKPAWTGIQGGPG